MTFGIVVILASGALYLAQHGWRLPPHLRRVGLHRHPQAEISEIGL
jgi:hypothetical protein